MLGAREGGASDEQQMGARVCKRKIKEDTRGHQHQGYTQQGHVGGGAEGAAQDTALPREDTTRGALLRRTLLATHAMLPHSGERCQPAQESASRLLRRGTLRAALPRRSGERCQDVVGAADGEGAALLQVEHLDGAVIHQHGIPVLEAGVRGERGGGVSQGEGEEDPPGSPLTVPSSTPAGHGIPAQSREPREERGGGVRERVCMATW